MITPFVGQKLQWKHGNLNLSYGLSHAGYDICISNIGEPILLTPFTHSGFTLIHTLETFNMPDNVVGEVKNKSTLKRLGLQVGAATMLEPGWRGYLTIEALATKQPVTLYPGMPIAQIVFSYLDQPVTGYTGKYQDQEDMPVGAR